MRASVRAAAIGVALCAVLGAGCVNPFGWGSNDIPLLASTEDLRFEAGVSVATLTVWEPRGNLSRHARATIWSPPGAPTSLIGPVEPTELTTHGLDPQTVTVHVNRTGVAPGTYTGSYVLATVAEDSSPAGGVAARIAVVGGGG